MKRKLVIFGAGDIAQLADFYFADEGRWDVCGFVVDDDYKTAAEFSGKPLIGMSELTSRFPPSSHAAFVALSYSGMNRLRAEKYLALKALGYEMASYVSPKCTNFSKSIGEHCFILEDNTIQPFVTIGNNVTLWSGNHIGHHSQIGDNCFISSHVVVSGGVKVENNCFIGVNATLRDHVVIGEETLIGAGVLITKSTSPRAVYRGQRADLMSITSDQIKGI